MRKYKNYLIDMDGVLIRGKTLIPGANEFIERLNFYHIKYLILTNNPLQTPRDLAHRLQTIGLNISPKKIFTSAMATARFLQSQKPNCKVFAIGESGLTQALHDAGLVLTDTNPDYVVLGETNSYNFDQITRAVRLIVDGALFIATNPDTTGPLEEGLVPACGSLAALIEKATGRAPFFIGKPNPLMMRSAMNYLGVHSEDTVMVGDRMDTDIVAGIMSGMETILVLTGVTSPDTLRSFPYRPSRIISSIKEIIVDLDKP
ncbi:MAG: HAD family hydrolase [Anaerolineae bacterium]|nr:HAD family hydrolase [Anaerolineae bacterium]